MTKGVFELPRTDLRPHADVPKEGDAVVVLRPDGSVGFFTLGMDADMIAAKVRAGVALSDEENSHLNVASKGFALSIAASSEMIMSILEDIANNPDIIDLEKIKAMTRVN